MGKLVLFGGILTRAASIGSWNSLDIYVYVYTVIFFTGASDIDRQSEKPIGENRQDHLYQTYISQSRLVETNINGCDV